MSVIDNNAYSNVFTTTIQPQPAAGAAPYGMTAPTFGGGANDTILPGLPFGGAMPGQLQTGQPQPSQSPSWNPGDGSGGLFGFANVMSGFLNALQGLMANLYQQLGFGGTGTQLPGAGAQPGGETFVTNATANSVGDPHDSFRATTGSGQTLADKWDNMQSHGDLLDSNSFAGGYRVSTTVTQPNSNGVTMNASASVALDGGATNITMNANGAFSVLSSSGANVQLQKGQTVQLGDGATVALGGDGALTVADTNAAGGTLSTRLASNGHGGVDVSSTATNVDLGGYLVNRTDAPPPTPLPVTPLPATPPLGAPSNTALPTTPLPTGLVSDPYPFESWGSPANTADPLVAQNAGAWNAAAAFGEAVDPQIQID